MNDAYCRRACVFLELVAAAFGLAVVSMAVDMAWCLFPYSRYSSPGVNVDGQMLLFVHAHPNAVGALILLWSFLRRAYVFSKRHPSQWLFWGSSYASQILASILLFFVAVSAVVTHMLPQ